MKIIIDGNNISQEQLIKWKKRTDKKSIIYIRT
ncbi:Uncharacterized protein B5E39_2681 [Bacillus cereus]|nr:Uncharacterized protein B5E39_2681 [Bacillus cereus]